MVVWLTVCGRTCAALLELGWMGRCRAQRALWRVVNIERPFRFIAEKTSHGLTQRLAYMERVFYADVLLLLYRQTWSWDGSVNLTHPQQQSNPPQAEPGKTDGTPSYRRAGLNRHSLSHHWLSQQLLWIISSVRVSAAEDVSWRAEIHHLTTGGGGVGALLVDLRPLVPKHFTKGWPLTVLTEVPGIQRLTHIHFVDFKMDLMQSGAGSLTSPASCCFRPLV